MSRNRAICTIIAKNYIASARTLARSFRALHPDDRCYVLIVDEFGGFVNPAEECFEVITLPELGIPDLPRLCFKYNITELCTAVKAHLLDYLVSEKAVDKLLYIDPDILITNRLDNIYESLSTFDLVLTPHIDVDYPEDDLLPDDGHVLKSGTFNLGFLGINSTANAKNFLAWWKPKLYYKCVIDHAQGYFVDQKFIDLVPGMFDNYLIEKAAGYNVAYWNLHSRRLSRENGSWRCNGGPLFFFHFSNYRPERPDIISQHTTRYRLSDRPDLEPLFSEYRALLHKNGYEQSAGWPYSYDFFDTGERIPQELRASYRGSPAEWGKLGDPFTSPVLKRRAIVMKWRNRLRAFARDPVASARRAFRTLHPVASPRPAVGGCANE